MLRRVLWFVIFACSISPAGAASPDEAAVEAVVRAWLEGLNDLDVDAMAAHATDDVVLIDPTMAPISGQQAARAAWQRSLPDAGVRITSATKELEVVDDIAWRIGAFARERANGQVTSRGQSLEIWKRVNGEWKLHRQMSSGLLARQPLLRRPLPSEPVLDSPRDKN